MDSFERLGVWWLPDEPDRDVAGVLRWSREEGVRLDLVGRLQEPETSNLFGREGLPHYSIVHGMLKDKVQRSMDRAVTLLGCQVMRDSGETSLPSEDVRATIALLDHYFTTTEPRFDHLKLRFDYLWDWAGISGFEHREVDADFTRWSMSWQLPDYLSASGIDNETITLGLGRKENLSIKPIRGLEEFAEIVVEVAEPLTIDELGDQYLRPIQNLLTLGVDYPVQVTSVRLSSPDVLAVTMDGTVRGRDYVHMLRQPGPHTVAPRRYQPYAHDMLFTLDDYESGWPQLIPTWLQLQDKLELAGDVFFGTRYAPASYLETRFLSIAQAVEGYHRRCFSNEDIPAEEHSRRLEEVLSAILEQHLEWAGSKLKYANEPSYARRIKELIKTTDPLLRQLLGKTSRFARAAVQSRNFYTHLKQESEDAVARGEDLFWLTEKLSWLLRVRLLLDLGFTHKHCAELLERNRAFRWAVAARPDTKNS